MKKLLMMGAILVLGTIAMAQAQEIGKTSAPVYLQAEIVTENLIVSGIDGRDILLDFGQINKNIQDGQGRGAEAEFKVEYVGSKQVSGNNLNMVLQDKEVPMSHTTISGANIMTATLAMSDRLGTSFVEQAGQIQGVTSLDDITAKGEIYRGKITGTLPSTDIKGATEGFYEGQTQLTVTLTGTAGEEIAAAK